MNDKSFDWALLRLCSLYTAIECEDLQSPANGLVVVPSRLPGSTATYSCNTGFNLIGSQTRSCLNNGFWSGVVPICQG